MNPHGPFKACGFSYRLRLSPPGRGALRGLTLGLRSGLSLHPPPENPELSCCPLVSTPSRLEYLSGLGSGLPFEVSPNLSSSASPVSQTSTQVFLESAAYAIPPRPRGSCRRGWCIVRPSRITSALLQKRESVKELCKDNPGLALQGVVRNWLLETVGEKPQ